MKKIWAGLGLVVLAALLGVAWSVVIDDHDLSLVMSFVSGLLLGGPAGLLMFQGWLDRNEARR
jgi:hypothetical protein